MDTETPKSAMEQLLAEHEELSSVPAVGDTINGVVMEKTGNALYIDIGAVGVGTIYGKELFDDLNTFEGAKIGQQVQATILTLDNEEGYVELSLRTATMERSWEELRRKYSDTVSFPTEIIDANKGGLIIRVSGVTGFLPVSQLAPDHYPRVEGGDKNKIFDRLKSYVGQQFTVKIIGLDQDEEKLIVSEKSAVSDVISSTLEQLGEGKVVEGTVSGVVDFGIFVKFTEGGQELEGLVHISELAWQRIDSPADIVSLGEKVKAKVIGIDDGLRISLSMKQLEEDPWTKVGDKYKVGDTVKGEILKVTPFGGFIKLDDAIHGLIHVSELPEEAKGDPTSVLKAGETMNLTIISLDPKEHRLGLSLRATTDKKEKKTERAEPTKKSKAEKKPATKKKTTKKKEAKKED
ncbi:MAG: S1 RNA-binding domain-containing protein [Candidatus Andersenbacteria bacterium]|nr:S1 RNA-binding domain-containing protein [Candidatus Andersenbacteria bacterium]